MVERRDVEFEVDGGDRLRGWLFAPEAGTLSCPAISMAHGYAGVKEPPSWANTSETSNREIQWPI